MDFTLMFGLGGTEDYLPLAKIAEEAGWSAISIPDSVFYPKVNQSDYPYADTDMVRQALEVTPVLDPFIAIAQMAAVTKTIQFYPGVLKVPVRHPLLLAKTMSSLAVMCNNRLKLGAGLSPWREDFDHLDVPFEPRGKMLDECIEIIRGVLSGEFYEYHSAFYDFDLVRMSPVPEQPIPILVGGHSKPALRRAARIGDGWMSANGEYDTLKELIGQLEAFRKEYGTDTRKDFEIHVMDVTAQTLDDHRKMRDLGVHSILACPWNPYDPQLTLEKKIDGIRMFSETIIAKFDA